MGKSDSTEKHSSKHKKRRKHDDNDDADRHRKHKHRKRDKDESKVNIVDDGDDEKLWIEKDIGMDGERVGLNLVSQQYLVMFIHLEPDSSSGYPNSRES